MRVGEILSLLKEYILFGIILLILFIIGYQIIYKKIMKGTKTISKPKFALYAISICYIVVVIGAVFFSRGGNYGVINLHLFSSYRQAYNRMQISLFRNIILNILLFVPFGFLLPFYKDKLKKSYITIGLGFLVNLIIELIQYITHIGIFEIDDILNNTLGVIIGYFAFLICQSLWKKENRKRIALYVLPMVATVCVFLGIYVKYQNQELGNLATQYDYKVNMKNVEVESNIEFSDEKTTQNIYSTKIFTENETKEIAQNIFNKLGTEIDESRTNIYEDEGIYYSKSHHSLWIKYKGGTYSYTDFEMFKNEGSSKDTEIQIQGNAEVAISTKDTKVRGKSKEEIREVVQKLGIEIPQNAEFTEDNGIYTFDIDMEFEEGTLTDGSIKCSYYEGDIISDLRYNIIKYEKVKEKEIISEKEAYEKIKQGKFQYSTYDNTKIEKIIIEDISIKYEIDSKGYYVPTYLFKTRINGTPQTLQVSAI